MSGRAARAAVKPKTMFYAAVGFVTYKTGKIFAKRKARDVLTGSEKSEKDQTD